MIELIVIPYNDKCDEQMYLNFKETAETMEKITKEKFSYNALVDFARNRIVFYLSKWNSYQQYYTIKQVNHLAERFANAYINSKSKLYFS